MTRFGLTSLRTALLGTTAAAGLLSVGAAQAQTSYATPGYASAGQPAYAAPNWTTVPTTGLYIAGAVGANWLLPYNLNPQSSLSGPLKAQGYGITGGRTTFDTGITGVASIGYGFGNGLRAELEGGYRGNNVNRITGFNVTGPGIPSGAALANRASNSGTQQTPSVMVNALYDFYIPSLPWMVPYVGAGIGAGWTTIPHDDIIGSAAAANGRPARLAGGGNSSSTMFAYQAMVGAAFPIESVPGLSVTAEYRFFGTQQPKYNATLYNAGTGAALATGSLKGYNNNNAVLIGLRYAFDTPVPAPVPAAIAPAAARTYLVFFDWDKYNLTDRARQIIAEAATTSKTTGTTRIEVGGHTDTTGTAQYNQALSIRRAEAVAAQLVRDGVPRSAIAISGYGFTRPLVPTGPNVREPQNRRVEIVLR